MPAAAIEDDVEVEAKERERERRKNRSWRVSFFAADRFRLRVAQSSSNRSLAKKLFYYSDDIPPGGERPAIYNQKCLVAESGSPRCLEETFRGFYRRPKSPSSPRP